MVPQSSPSTMASQQCPVMRRCESEASTASGSLRQGGSSTPSSLGKSFCSDAFMQRKGVGKASGKGKGTGKGKGAAVRREVLVLENGTQAAEGFALRGAVLGKGGENFAAIRDETRVRLWLAGKGSGKEGEEEGPLRMVLEGREPEAMVRALELAHDLAETVRGRNKAQLQREEGKGKGRNELAEQLRVENERMEARMAKAKEQEQELQRRANESRRLLEEAKERMTRQVMTEEVVEARKAAAGGCVESAKVFWEALEKSRSQEVTAEAAEAREAVRQARRAVVSTQALRKQMHQLQASAAMAANGLAAKSRGRCCALFANGSCPFKGDQCPRGSHEEPAAPLEGEVFRKITKAKLRLVQQKWGDAGGRGDLLSAWQIRNPRLEFLFRGAEANFAELYDGAPDVIDAWHGSGEENVVSIAINGFDPKRRSGQVFGAGEYFAKDPNVSIGYARGGSFMFLCKLLLGKQDVDHTWASGPRYYVIKQREGRMQVLPLFLLQFKSSSSPFHTKLTTQLALSQDVEDPGTLAGQQRGGLSACEARRDAGMAAQRTRHLWLGWLSPLLRLRDDDEVAKDVCEFLDGIRVQEVVPERNGARIGAFVLLEEAISKATFQELGRRKYHGEWRISVDDAQPGNPKCAGKVCPRLSGPSKYCRGWNIRGHAAWQWGCPFAHPEECRPTFGVEPSMELVPKGSAKFDEIATDLQRSIPFARIVRIQRSQNPALEKMYEERRSFIQDKQGFAVEKELWHGTSVDAIPILLKHGLQPPSDTQPSEQCPVSGGKGLCTTLCGADCKHCNAPHVWGKCHMYGLGVYLADIAQKSHQYVRKSGSTYSMLRCRVCLGNPYLIEGNLLSGKAMHDLCWCQDPSEFLESLAEDWSVSKGHDCYYVKGQSGGQKQGLGVHNSEYIVFQPFQILPLYRVDYTA